MVAGGRGAARSPVPWDLAVRGIAGPRPNAGCVGVATLSGSREFGAGGLSRQIRAGVTDAQQFSVAGGFDAAGGAEAAAGGVHAGDSFWVGVSGLGVLPLVAGRFGAAAASAARVVETVGGEGCGYGEASFWIFGNSGGL